MWIALVAAVAIVAVLLWLRFKPAPAANSTTDVSISSLRNAVTTAGGTPTAFDHVTLLRQLITAWGGTPTYFDIVSLLRQAITTAGGTPTQYAQAYLLRQLITTIGGTPATFSQDKLYDQLATLASLAPPASTLGAPVLSYPSPFASNPTTISAAIPADWQSGDVFKLARSASVTMSGSTILTHTLTDADILAGTFSIGLSGVTLSGTTYFRAYGAHGGLDSVNLSNIVAWGDTTAPSITTSATQSVTETLPLSIALTANETVSWAIAGGVDQLAFEISGTTLRWIGNGSQSASSPLDQGSDNVYDVIVQATDLGGNIATKAIAVTVNAADLTPDAFSWTNVTSAALSTTYTAANTWTVSGLTAGVNAPLSVAGGLISKNGGAFSSSATTVQNGDQIQARGNSSSGYSTTVNVAVTVGTLTATFAIITQANPAAASFTPSVAPAAQTNSATTHTFTNQSFGAGFPVVVAGAFFISGASITPSGGGATITLSKIIANDDPSRLDVSIWRGPSEITAGNYDVVLTFSAANNSCAIQPGTLSVPSHSGTVSATNSVAAASQASYAASITVPTDGVWIAAAISYGASESFTWSNGSPTEDCDFDVSASGPRFSVAHGMVGATVAATPAVANFGAMCLASWGP